ncbi:MAG: MATE family efflux transporter [Peptoniphilaceae bacterium]|nr:MATE family efflux transporter [Peptoniphilaceae bacterium]MDY6019300.1 MATE family efflux transporter [Anaerococcus sp.]
MKSQLDLLNDDIEKSLIKLSIPLTLTAFVQMTYNLVDTIWIGRLGTDAVAAVGVASFVIWLANSIGFIPKIGMGVYSSQAYGKNDKKKAVSILTNGYLQAFIISLIFMVTVIIFKDTFIGFYKLKKEVNQLTDSYLSIINIGFCFLFINPMFSQAYHSIGDSMTPFKINCIGLVFNIVMDPILIFGLGFFPAMGIKGAALATITAQAIVSLIFIFYMKAGDSLMGESLKKFEFSFKWQARIFKLGLPASILNTIHAFIAIILNRFMAYYGAVPVAVYTIGSQLESITWMTTEGCQVAISSLVAQNYGAEKYQRVLDSNKQGLKLVTYIGIFATIFLFALRNVLFIAFVPDDPETIALGAKYLAILSASELFMAIEIGATGVFNGLSDTRTPALISVIFNIARIPFSLFFMRYFDVLGVWIAMSLSSIIKGILCFALLEEKIKKEIKTKIA